MPLDLHTGPVLLDSRHWLESEHAASGYYRCPSPCLGNNDLWLGIGSTSPFPVGTRWIRSLSAGNLEQGVMELPSSPFFGRVKSPPAGAANYWAPADYNFDHWESNMTLMHSFTEMAPFRAGRSCVYCLRGEYLQARPFVSLTDPGWRPLLHIARLLTTL